MSDISKITDQQRQMLNILDWTYFVCHLMKPVR